MSALADAQRWPEADVPGFNVEERDRMRRFRLPNERRGQPMDKRYYPRRPVENVREWFADHAAKLRGLEKAAGL